MPVSSWYRFGVLSTSVLGDVLHSLGLGRNMNEQLHRPVLFCVCMKYLLSDVNIKDVPRKGN